MNETNETRTNDFLATERLGKLMRQYAVPCVISLLVAALYNIVDQIFIANASYLGSYGSSYGAGGKTVWKLVADRLHIRYYDAELLEEAAKSSGMNKKFLESVDEKPVESSVLYQYIGFTSNKYVSIKEMADQAQREIIERVALEGSCVIVGRRADLILKDNPNVLRIFITAST